MLSVHPQFITWTCMSFPTPSQQLTPHRHNSAFSLNSSQPAYLCSLLSYHIPACSLCSSNTNPLSVPRVHTTFASRSFSQRCVQGQHGQGQGQKILSSRTPSLVSAWLPPQSGTHSLLAFGLVFHHIHSVVFLKPTEH